MLGKLKVNFFGLLKHCFTVDALIIVGINFMKSIKNLQFEVNVALADV